MSSYRDKLKAFFMSDRSAPWRDFLWIVSFGAITLRLVMPVFAESIPAEAGADQGVAQAPANPGVVTPPVLRPELFRPPGPSASLYKGTSLESAVNQQLANALVKTAGKAGSLAKTAAQSIGDYMRERQIQKMQEELVQRFYYNLDFYLDPYRLPPEQRRAVVMKVEQIYIEDGQTNEHGLDTISFREMPGVIKKVYGDLLLEEARDGEVRTYYINGRLQTIWKLKDGVPPGPVVTYYADSTEILHIDVYDAGRKISRKKYDSSGKLEFEQNYDYAVPASAAPAVLEVKAEPVSVPAAQVNPAPPEQAAPAAAEEPAPAFHEAE